MDLSSSTHLSSAIFFATSVGILPLITTFFKKEDLNWDNCGFALIYFTAVGIGVSSAIREPNTIHWWTALFCYILSTISGFIVVYRRDKDEE